MNRRFFRAASGLLTAAVLLTGIWVPGQTEAYAATQAELNVPANAVEWNGHYYKVIRSNKVPTAAEKYCNKLGGHLVTITSQAEQNFLNSYIDPIDYDSYTIGATDEGHEGVWTWMTSETWEYSNWYPGGSAGTYEPNNGYGGPPDNYAMMSRDRNWNWVDVTDGKEDSRWFICEWESYNLGIEDTKITIKEGERYNISYSILGDISKLSNRTVTWKTSKASVVKVSSKGMIYGKGAGKATITASVGLVHRTITVVVTPSTPAKVTGVAKCSATASSITLQWKKVAKASFYEIYMYDPDIQEYTLVKTVKGTKSRATVTGLDRNTRYRFRIRAVRESLKQDYPGKFSKVVKIRTAKR